MLVEGIAHSPLRHNAARQVAAWWDEVDRATHTRQVPRARRFLRWILATHPEDEEAWLRLAQLASTQREQLAYLRQAYTFHPHSRRTLAALREARGRQLASAAKELSPLPAALHCLPDQRRNGRGAVHPGNGDRPAASHVLKTVRRSRIWSVLSLF
jgi:hypothetical protein